MFVNPCTFLLFSFPWNTRIPPSIFVDLINSVKSCLSVTNTEVIAIDQDPLGIQVGCASGVYFEPKFEPSSCRCREMSSHKTAQSQHSRNSTSNLSLESLIQVGHNLFFIPFNQLLPDQMCACVWTYSPNLPADLGKATCGQQVRLGIHQLRY